MDLINKNAVLVTGTHLPLLLVTQTAGAKLTPLFLTHCSSLPHICCLHARTRHMLMTLLHASIRPKFEFTAQSNCLCRMVSGASLWLRGAVMRGWCGCCWTTRRTSTQLIRCHSVPHTALKARDCKRDPIRQTMLSPCVTAQLSPV